MFIGKIPGFSGAIRLWYFLQEDGLLIVLQCLKNRGKLQILIVCRQWLQKDMDRTATTNPQQKRHIVFITAVIADGDRLLGSHHLRGIFLDI